MSAVLLYYKYIDLSEQREAVRLWMLANCSDLGLKGRIRVAHDGVNVTVGGLQWACRAHCAAVSAHPVLQGADIDFKLSQSDGTPNESCRLESGFDTLSVRLVNELVTLGPRAMGRARAENSGRHLPPVEFHQQLREAGLRGANDAVLLDVRNVYESRIGQFQQTGLDTFAPTTRCFSALPQWIDDHAHLLQSKTVFMYCTGGVRCERASAYLREKGAGFQNVVQLKGGIVRYLEQFPDGGFFQGRNFVFDERVAHGPADRGSAAVGRCSQCQAPYDDYSARHRCSRCRLLMLVCDKCAKVRSSESAQPMQSEASVQALPCAETQRCSVDLICELCLPRPLAGPVSLHRQGALPLGGSGGSTNKATAPVRLLALHGFRENASRFRGRLRGLMKRWGSAVHLEFVDAPHRLMPALEHATRTPAAHNVGGTSAARLRANQNSAACHGQSGGADSELEASGEALQPCMQPQRHLPGAGKHKCAWFVQNGAEQQAACLGGLEAMRAQTEGWLASLKAVNAAVASKGPFDGIVAFSQGCAMATFMAALQQLSTGTTEAGTVLEGAGLDTTVQRDCAVAAYSCTPIGDARKAAVPQTSKAEGLTEQLQRAIALCNWHVRFVMLCCGHAGGSEEVAAAVQAAEPVRVPSLHVFGCTGGDRQVQEACSRQLAQHFADAELLMHERGHMIPSAKADAARYLDFFRRHCGACDAAFA